MSDEKISKHEILKNGLNTKQAAAYIGLARKTLDNKRAAGTGPHYWRYGNVVIYHKPDLDDYLDENMNEYITAKLEVGPIADSICRGDLSDFDSE